MLDLLKEDRCKQFQESVWPRVLYRLSDVVFQSNATFIEQSFNTEVVSYIYFLTHFIASACIACRLFKITFVATMTRVMTDDGFRSDLIVRSENSAFTHQDLPQTTIIFRIL